VCCTVITGKENSNKKQKYVTEKKFKQQCLVNLRKHCFAIFFVCGNNLGGSWLCFRNDNPHVIFTRKPVPLSILTSAIRENACSHRCAVGNGERTSSVGLMILEVIFHLVAPKRTKICCAEDALTNFACLKLSDVIHVMIVYVCCCSDRTKWLLYQCWILPSVSNVVLKITLQFLQNISGD